MSDGDLTQFNRVAANAEAAVTGNALTSAMLLPTDGKKITAENNSAGKAPVNRSLKRIGEWLAGIMGAIFGNVTGVTRRTVHSWHADGTGMQASTANAGEVKAFSDIVTEEGNVLVESARYVRVGGGVPAQRTFHTNAALEFQNTQDAANLDANPPGDGPQQNRQCAKNICKAWISLSTDGSGGYTIHDRYNIASVALSSAPNEVRVDFAGTFADNNYAVSVAGTDTSDTFGVLNTRYIHADKNAAYFPLGLKNDPTAEPMHIDLIFFGKQNS